MGAELKTGDMAMALAMAMEMGDREGERGTRGAAMRDMQRRAEEGWRAARACGSHAVCLLLTKAE